MSCPLAPSTLCLSLSQAHSERDVLYLHLLFALRDPSVGTLESNFSSTLFYAFTTLQVQAVLLFTLDS